MTKVAKAKSGSKTTQDAKVVKVIKGTKPARAKAPKATKGQKRLTLSTPPTEIVITGQDGLTIEGAANPTFTISGTTASIPAVPLIFRIYDMVLEDFQMVPPQNYVPGPNWSATFTVDVSTDGLPGDVVEFRVKVSYLPLGQPDKFASTSTGVFVLIPE